MGGRGSGGGRNGKASAGGSSKKEELINLYNNISGNPSYTVDERVRAMSSIKKEIDKIDNNNKISTKRPYLKNIDDKKEVDALKTKTLKSIDKLQKKYNWYGDQKLNQIKDQLTRTSISDGEGVLLLADTFYNHKPKYIKRVKSF